MKNMKQVASKGVFLFVLLSLFTIGFPLQAANQNQQLELIAGSEGSIKVIIKLQVPQINKLTATANKFRTPDSGKESTWSGSQADTALMNAITYSAQGVLQKLKGTAYGVHHIYKSIPYMALQVSADGLAILRSSPEVLGIEEDIPMKLIEPVIDNGQPKGNNPPSNIDPPLLDISVNLIGANTAWSMGYTGSGRYVAIVDTGIRSTHQFFQGKTIIEACYAKGSDNSGPAGDCPNGLISMTGAGSAIHYPNTYQGYDHGTHVSGIATGNNGVLFGVAKDANIIAVKVFSMFPETYLACSGVSCVLSWSSDQLAGLDYIYTIRGSYSIAAVNMSIGGGSNASACDSDSRKAVIDNLRAAGIATAIATGNNGYCGFISSPACISTSVAVGSTTDGDLESAFNNWHPTMQKLFAPGSTIYSSTGASDNSYASWGGTSMATPHVAGAWALMKQAKPTATVTEILSALQSTGVPIISTCPGNTASISRIQVNTAINALTADLAVSIATPTPATLTVGNPVSDIITITNNGPGAASGATMVATVPGNFVSVSATPSQGTCNLTFPNISCNFGTIGNGSSATVTIVGTPISAGNESYSANVGSAISDPVPANNNDTYNISVVNPVPVISSLSPASAHTGGAAFTLTVNGSNFVSGSTVQWHGADRTTTFVSFTRLTAQILASDIAASGTTAVTVVNPIPGGGTSNTSTFTVSSQTSIGGSGGGGGGGGGCFITMTTQQNAQSGLDWTVGKINLALLISLSSFFCLLAWYKIRLKKTCKN